MPNCLLIQREIASETVSIKSNKKLNIRQDNHVTLWCGMESWKQSSSKGMIDYIRMTTQGNANASVGKM